MTTANKITVVRILMIPIFVTLAIYYGQSIEEGSPQDWQRFAAICKTVATFPVQLGLTRTVPFKI